MAETWADGFTDRALAGVQRDCENRDSGRSYIVTDYQYLIEVLRLARIGLATERGNDDR